MYATWPMVFGALVAGAVGGLMVPERPASSSSAVSKWASGKSGATNNETASKPAQSTATKPADSVAAKLAAADAKPAKTVAETSVTPAPKSVDAKPMPTTNAASPTKVAAQPNESNGASCETEKWPYRSANCLDRTAVVLPAETVVKAKRVDPAVSMTSTSPGEGAKQIAEEKSAPKPEKEKEKKTASVVPYEEDSERNDRRSERTARAESDEREIRSEPNRRTAQRRVTTRRAAGPDDEYTGRVYYRDSYGRLYLAPELRNQLPPPPRYWR